MLDEVFADLHSLDLGQSVVDIGAGFGYSTRYLLSRGLRVCAVDVDPGVLSSLRAAFGEFVKAGLLKLYHAPAEHLPLRDGECDSAVSIMALHHFKNVEAALREMLRVTKKLVVVYDWAPSTGGVTNPHSPAELKAKMEEAVSVAKRLGLEVAYAEAWYKLAKRKA